jgi:retinol-binding protein 3
MFFKTCVILFLGLGVGLGTATAQPAIPDTPAGHTLNAWLTAFNSGDRKLIQAYYSKYEQSYSVDDAVAGRQQTGGYELLQILKSEPLHVQFLVKERNSAAEGIGDLIVKAREPAQVEHFWFARVPSNASVSGLALSIDTATRARVIRGAIKDLNDFYLFPKVAAKMDEAVEAHKKKGDYDSLTDGNEFAATLTNDLQAVSHDKHLRVFFSAVPISDRPPAPNPASDPQFRKQMRQINCGFEKMEILLDNIGYLKFDMFADPGVCRDTTVAAMNFLSNADALIFDLRENGGGDPAMVEFICSYLFSKPTHLNDIWRRQGNTTQQFWTLASVPGKRLVDAPIYILTSRQTFSGAEEFCYDLQNLKRATIVGETTGGGAHLVGGHPIDPHFGIGVPFAEAINPISKTNWEGTGVVPNVKVSAADALSAAEKLAENRLASRQSGARKPSP